MKSILTNRTMKISFSIIFIVAMLFYASNICAQPTQVYLTGQAEEVREISPGKDIPDGDIMHIRSSVAEFEFISGELNGYFINVVDAELNLLTGDGNARGTTFMVVSYGELNGVFEWTESAPVREFCYETKGHAMGQGDFLGTRASATFTGCMGYPYLGYEMEIIDPTGTIVNGE